MKEFFRDIFEYHHHFNRELIKQLKQFEDQLSDRTIPLLSHNVNAHQIWNSRILGGESLGVNEVHDLYKCSEQDRNNYDTTSKIIDDLELDLEIEYGNSAGNTFKNSIRDILFHVANHTTHHRGQIISDLRMKGIAPIKTDYIFYKR